ncbi:hypothetical protein LAG90_12070 [Marinilongibacter aquaticus]|uniref:hypothetical protein n=1 Tax=Marinilongibacter aquaticus TaxID=2975157 RepID=UPI0021BD0973|nr:hypothetical protein [Marinilongibacter aquaticus]UBM57554.1 hypothetical protein LAG90_12070 [Marinilongibacter aquaticus]
MTKKLSAALIIGILLVYFGARLFCKPRIILIGCDFDESKGRLVESYFIAFPPQDEEKFIDVMGDFIPNNEIIGLSLKAKNYRIQYFYKETLIFNRWYYKGFLHGGIDPSNVLTDPIQFRKYLLGRTRLTDNVSECNPCAYTPSYSLYYEDKVRVYSPNGWEGNRDLKWKEFEH